MALRERGLPWSLCSSRVELSQTHSPPDKMVWDVPLALVNRTHKEQSGRILSYPPTRNPWLSTTNCDGMYMPCLARLFSEVRALHPVIGRVE
jgi:hypothetical protein